MEMVFTPNFAHFMLVFCQNVFSLKPDFTGNDLTWGAGNELQNGGSCHRFTASGFPDNTQGLALVHGQVDALERFYNAFVDGEMDDETLDVQ